jgi:hypothetical protein
MKISLKKCLSRLQLIFTNGNLSGLNEAIAILFLPNLRPE